MSLNQFCGNHMLSPTSGPNPRDLNGVYHYEGCCHQFDSLMKEIKRESIMTRMYEFKINGWKCSHDDAFYDQKKIDNDKQFQENQHVPEKQLLPPLLIFRYNFPKCCTSHTNPDFKKYINKIPYEINDALNDPETIEKFNTLYPKF
jgi:hypothetical protein